MCELWSSLLTDSPWIELRGHARRALDAWLKESKWLTCAYPYWCLAQA